MKELSIYVKFLRASCPVLRARLLRYFRRGFRQGVVSGELLHPTDLAFHPFGTIFLVGALTRRESCHKALVVLGMAGFILYIVIVFARLHYSRGRISPESGLRLSAIVAINPLVVHAVLQNGGVVNTTDGGLTWSTPVAGTVGNPTLGMSFLDSMTGFVVGSAGVISKTTDGGATWAALPPPQTDFAFFQMKIISAAEIYAVGSADFLYKSTDLGSTWTPLPNHPRSRNFRPSRHLRFLFTRETRVVDDHVRRLRCNSTIDRRRDELDLKQFPTHRSTHERYPGSAEHEHSRGRRPSTDGLPSGRCFVRRIWVIAGARSTFR